MDNPNIKFTKVQLNLAEDLANRTRRPCFQARSWLEGSINHLNNPDPFLPLTEDHWWNILLIALLIFIDVDFSLDSLIEFLLFNMISVYQMSFSSVNQNVISIFQQNIMHSFNIMSISSLKNKGNFQDHADCY